MTDMIAVRIEISEFYSIIALNWDWTLLFVSYFLALITHSPFYFGKLPVYT